MHVRGVQVGILPVGTGWLVSSAANTVRKHRPKLNKLSSGGIGRHQKKKSRSWALRSALPCLRKRTSSASSAQNSLQKNCPFGARHGCSSPLTIGSCFPQNAQRAAASVSLRHSLIYCPCVYHEGVTVSAAVPYLRLIFRASDTIQSGLSTPVAKMTHI